MKKLLSLLTVIFCFVCVIAQTPERKVLVEELTSSTCGPCAQLNNLFNPWLANNAEKVTVIKYQMNWPGTGDPYYTAEGGTRRSYYNVGGVPAPFVNGVAPNDNVQTYQQWMNNIAEAINTAYTQPAYIELTASFYRMDQTIYTTVNITPTKDFPEGNNLRLFVAIAEKETYKNKKSNGETVFHHVMKKFMTPAAGTVLGALTANETITYDLSWEFKGEYRLPPSGASNLINHNIEHSVEDFDNLEVVVWVQNYSTKAVENSCNAKEPVTLVFNPTTENGELIATVAGNPITSGETFELGTTIEFTAIPNENFEVKEWKLNDEIVPDNTSNSYILTLENDATVTVEFVEIVGIKDINGVAISIAPNPVNDILYITGQYDNLEIFSISGQIVSTAYNQPSIDVKHLSKGIYFVKISSNGQTSTFKIVK